LKNTDIWINEDFSKATAGIKKNLISEIKRRRNNGTTKLENLIEEITITMMTE